MHVRCIPEGILTVQTRARLPVTWAKHDIMHDINEKLCYATLDFEPEMQTATKSWQLEWCPSLMGMSSLSGTSGACICRVASASCSHMSPPLLTHQEGMTPSFCAPQHCCTYPNPLTHTLLPPPTCSSCHPHVVVQWPPLTCPGLCPCPPTPTPTVPSQCHHALLTSSVMPWPLVHDACLQPCPRP